MLQNREPKFWTPIFDKFFENIWRKKSVSNFAKKRRNYLKISVFEKYTSERIFF